MNCHDIKIIMEDGVDGAISEEDVASIKHHMQQCESCHRLWADELKFWELAGAYPNAPQVGDNFTASVMKNVMELEAEEKVIEFPQRKAQWHKAVAACFIAALLAGGAVTFLRSADDSGVVAASVPASDDEIIANLELIENLELLENLEFYADLDVVENMEDSI